MQLFIVAVGKARGSTEHRLAEGWLGRLPEGGSIHEIESKLPAGAKRTDDEGVRLLRAVPPGAALAILDPRGKDYSSEDFFGRCHPHLTYLHETTSNHNQAKSHLLAA